MARHRNKHHQCYSREQLDTLAEETRLYIGRDYDVDYKNLVLTVLALPRRYKAKKETLTKDRDKRKEKFERREK